MSTTITTTTTVDRSSTSAIVPEIAVTITTPSSYQDIVKQSSSDDTATTQNTCDTISTTITTTTTTNNCCTVPSTTSTTTSSTSSSHKNNDTTTNHSSCNNNNNNTEIGLISTSTTTATTSLSDATGVIMDNTSPDPKQRPRRNLTMAFEALCITTSTNTSNDDNNNNNETIKEEKSDNYDDLMGIATNGKMTTILSPTTVVMNSSNHMNHDKNDLTSVSIIEEATSGFISPKPIVMLRENDDDDNIDSPIIESSSPEIAAVSSSLSVVVQDNNIVSPMSTTTSTPSPAAAGTASNGDVVDTGVIVPELQLHDDLRLKLSSYTVERVSCYSIIHDINKETTMMASHDPLLLQQCPSSTMETTTAESLSPLVLEGHGTSTAKKSLVQQSSPMKSSQQHRSSSVLTIATSVSPSNGALPEYAVIDEEKWLLASIANRSTQETATNTSTQCPATFLQAMGEKEYDLSTVTIANQNNNNNNTGTTTSTVSSATRTQLWKPSRSWWEAKSGKNPWIEPASHNKRWRYLWPLIHYHKFVHKCIKKLKRNGVDVKVSVTPVSVFLREEVCAISDHLATVSLFGSEEWMDCLSHFNGWTDMNASESIQMYQKFVQTLPLRSLQEPIDIDSPLLRSQIDEAFLRTVANQRDTSTAMATGMNYYQQQGTTASVTSSKFTRNQPGNTIATTNTTATAATTNGGGPPPMYPHSTTSYQLQNHHHHHHNNHLPVPRQINGVRRSRYLPGGWYPPGHVHPGWENLPIDASSVHSELSANSYPQPPSSHNQHHPIFHDTATVAAQAAHYHMYHPSVGPPPYYHHHPPATVDGLCVPSEMSHSSEYSYADPYGNGWMDPSMGAYTMHPQYYPPPTQYYSVPKSTEKYTAQSEHDNQPDSSESDETEAHNSLAETPYKLDMDQSYTMMSPYWSHLDQATLAMGLATPAVISPATTPRRPVMMSCGSSRSSAVKKLSHSASRVDSVAEDEASVTITETDDEYYVTEVKPFVAPIYPGQRFYHTSNGNANVESFPNPSHINYYSTYDNNVRVTTGSTSRNIVPPSPASQFMMSPQAGFAYNYGYGISPARIPRRTVASGGIRQKSGSTSTTSANSVTSLNTIDPNVPIGSTSSSIDVTTTTATVLCE